MPTNDSQLKKIIREEKERIMEEILKTGTLHAEVVEKWRLSLQRIEDYCKERNRY